MMKKSLLIQGGLAFTMFLATMLPLGAHAEMSEIKVAQQYGISYLPLMIMEEQKLIEKHAKANGVDVTVGDPDALRREPHRLSGDDVAARSGDG